MKIFKLLIIAISCSLILTNCQTPSDKALKLSEKELFTFLNDFDSYENIEISEPLPAKITVEDDAIYIDKIKEYEELDKLVGEISYNALLNGDIEYQSFKHANKFKSLKELKKDIENIENTFVPYEGLKSVQKLRANNTANAKVIVTIIWIYDKELSKVVSYRIIQ